MKLIKLTEEISEFDQPVQDEAGKIRYMQTKVKSLSHHRAILLPRLQELGELKGQGKLTPTLRQQMIEVERKLKIINDQFKQFNIRVGKSKIANPSNM